LLLGWHWPLAGVLAGQCVGGSDVAPPVAHPRHRHREPLPGADSPGGSPKLLSLSDCVLSSTASAELSEGQTVLLRSQTFRKAPA